MVSIFSGLCSESMITKSNPEPHNSSVKHGSVKLIHVPKQICPACSLLFRTLPSCIKHSLLYNTVLLKFSLKRELHFDGFILAFRNHVKCLFPVSQFERMSD